MKLSDVFARHRRSLLVLVVLAVATGVLAGLNLPVGLFPNIIVPRVIVSIQAGDRPIAQMATVITRPLEQAARAVPGTVSVRSTSSRGGAELQIDYLWGTDMNLTLQRVEAALTSAVATLPPGVTYTARRMSPTVYPVAAYSLMSNRQDGVALRNYAEYTLKPLLANVPGVTRVDTLGGGVEEYRVDVDPLRLRAFGLALVDVTDALGAANVLTANGKLQDRGKLYLTLSDSSLKSEADIRDVVVKSAAGGVVRLGDVADVGLTAAPQWLRVTADRQPAVSVQIYQQPSGDTVRIVKGVAAVLAKAKAGQPPGIVVKNWYDQSELIKKSASDLAMSIAVGAVLAGLVLLVFLRNLRITLVAMVVVPTVLAITTLALKLIGQSFNIMTLGGMAAAIGLIIDDAIVMIEHMERRLTQSTEAPVKVMRAAAEEFLRPLSASSAATTLIFLPLAFLSGITGAFFKPLSLTMAVALVVSFFVAWLVVPILVERLYRNAKPKAAKREGGVMRTYRKGLKTLTGAPWLAAAVIAPLLAVGVWCFLTLPSGFMPSTDEGGFILDYITPPGTSLQESDRLVSQIGNILADTPEVITYSRRLGAQLGGGLTEANVGDFFARLKTGPRRPIEAVMTSVRDKVDALVPGVQIDTAQLIEDEIGDLTAVPQPIEIKLYGPDQTVLHATADNVAKGIQSVRGIAEVNNGVVVAGDDLDIHIDPARTALEGVTAVEVSRQLTAMLSGDVSTQVQSGVALRDVRVWVPPERREHIADVAQLSLRATDGHLFKLSQVATVDISPGQAEIEREGGQLMNAVTARVVGRDLGSTAKAVLAVLGRPGLIPAHVTYQMGGLYAQQQSAFRGLSIVFASAIAIVTVLLLLIYENFRIVAAIVAMPLLAACAVALGLRLTGVQLNIMAIMGLTMVIGIVTEVAIFYFTEYQGLLEEGLAPRQALLDAGANRFRPIAMTTLAAILALSPLALGASMQKPLAIAIIAGLIAQGPLVLLVMPALFRLIGGVDRSVGHDD